MLLSSSLRFVAPWRSYRYKWNCFCLFYSISCCWWWENKVRIWLQSPNCALLIERSEQGKKKITQQKQFPLLLLELWPTTLMPCLSHAIFLRVCSKWLFFTRTQENRLLPEEQEWDQLLQCSTTHVHTVTLRLLQNVSWGVSTHPTYNPTVETPTHNTQPQRQQENNLLQCCFF